MQKLNPGCPCKRIKCERHGNCEECKKQHALKKKYLPACERIKQKEQRNAEKRAEQKR
ncbi:MULTISPECIES: hypothetical protein [unclassified Ruminococcus]|uniref:hypothetical protein n=1 Tax=unclassified Ruminococcus TaxID=2608920 RepID=UPI00210AFDC9|nr:MULTISPECIES: hypothetical protein [unclassified Ruminococcus]